MDDGLILVLGGARSGKSTFAQKLATRLGSDHVLFLATAQPDDDEMQTRIEVHRRDRPKAWTTVESPRHLAAALVEHLGSHKAVVIDCLGMLVSNVLCTLEEPHDHERAEALIREEVSAIVDAARSAGSPVIIVSNEVGTGLVPTTPIGRLFRDLLGRANQIVAERADQVYLLVAGIAVELKELQTHLHLRPHEPTT